MFSNLSAIVGNVRAGQLRAVGVTSAKRAPALPDVPTLAESGLPGFEAATWFALVAPAGTPQRRARRGSTPKSSARSRSPTSSSATSISA